LTDTELLRQAQCGDMDAWRLLYAQCMPSVWRHALALTGDVSVTEDVVSETFLGLVRAIRDLDPDTIPLHAWLRGVVRNKVADERRQKSKHDRLLAAAIDEGAAEDGDGSSAAVEAEESRQQIRGILHKLPEQQQIILEWKHIDDLSVRDIATRTGQTEKAVEAVLYRARKEFRRLYELSDSGGVGIGENSGHGLSTLEKSL